MLWRKMSFETALLKLVEGFEEEPDAERLALVWREGGEYNVLPTWLLPHIGRCLDWKAWVVVMCPDRDEVDFVRSLLKGEIE